MTFRKIVVGSSTYQYYVGKENVVFKIGDKKKIVSFFKFIEGTHGYTPNNIDDLVLTPRDIESYIQSNLNDFKS